MPSNAHKGSYYKARTKRYLEARGYQVVDLELVRWVYRDGRPAFATKKDQLAADLLAVSAASVIFVQVKGGASARIGHFPDARRKFQQYQFPPWTRQWVIAWPTGSRVPRIVQMQKESRHGETTQPAKEFNREAFSRTAHAVERLLEDPRHTPRAEDAIAAGYGGPRDQAAR